MTYNMKRNGTTPKRPGERGGAPGKAMRKRGRMLRVQSMKQEDFSGALLLTGGIRPQKVNSLLLVL